MLEMNRRGVTDFSDLEHLALSLLIDRQTMKKTEAAETISNRYREIMIDEYQDVNGVQELIFNAVSRDGANIFMVGDVKQSIYRFRLADPSIFLDKYLRFADAEPLDEALNNKKKTVVEGSRIMLSKNFRSRPGVINAVNYVFDRIMSKEFGEMDYTQTEALIADREADDDNGCAFEFDIIDMSTLEQDDDEESPAAIEIEAQYTADRIDRLIKSGYCVPDENGVPRPVSSSDIAILLRSVKGKAWRYAAALAQRGITADLPSDEGFLETPEISVALAIISIVDNPMQDIPLVAAMRSLAYGFSSDELAMIRAQSPSTDYYNALLRASETNKKCADFIEEINKLRELAPDMTADRFIWHMYSVTGLPGRVGAMRDGARRRGNLIILAEYARRYEQSGYKGLFGFLTYIRSLQQRGAEPAHAPDNSTSMRENEDAVKIMSIHKSKGLEFPVVVLADTAKRFNNRDLSSPIVFHPELGVGVKFTDRQRRIEYPTLARLAIQGKLTSEMMAEELRLLYVAMTRAREKLIITATFKDTSKELERLPAESGNKPAVQLLEESGSMAKWLMLALAEDIKRRYGKEAESEEVIEAAEAAVVAIVAEAAGNAGNAEDAKHTEGTVESINDKLITKINKNAANIGENDNANIDTDDDIVDSLVEELRERFTYVYPHSIAPELPSKLTATGLKGYYTEAESDSEAGKADFLVLKDFTAKAKQALHTFKRPQFIEKETGLTPAERGTAMHLTMQLIDFDKCSSKAGVEGEVCRLVDSGMLTAEQSNVIETEKITAFFAADIGKRITKADFVKREFRFILLSPAERFYRGGGEDKILLQGMVDCFFEENGQLTVIDFKTDYVTAQTVDEKKEQYTPQLAIYSEALERITGKPVKERVIHFFSIDQSFFI